MNGQEEYEDREFERLLQRRLVDMEDAIIDLCADFQFIKTIFDEFKASKETVNNFDPCILH